MESAVFEGQRPPAQTSDAVNIIRVGMKRLEDGLNIVSFMEGYKFAWESNDPSRFCALFANDGVYHNTPFASQRGHAHLAEYWSRVKLQKDVDLHYEVLVSTPTSGIAHWHVTYQVASEELFQIWAASAGTGLPAR